jgi:outer membrane protein assembly factor BamE
MKPWVRDSLLVLVLACLGGCSADESQRQVLMRGKYPSYPEHIKQAIDSGTLVKGMTQEQVLLAIGRTPCVNSRTLKGKTYDSWAYQLDQQSGKLVVPSHCSLGRQAVVFENGYLTEWDAK